MTSLFFRNLFFTILQPGMVAGVIPMWLASAELEGVHPGLNLPFVFGMLTFLVGLTVMITCIVSFARQGKGTLSPADPTTHLVAKGLYRYSRNPMYVGVMLILIGESIITSSQTLFVYSAFILLLFHMYVIFFEEPRLRKDFGEDYTRYCEEVRRWF
ncbi:MAG TPA: isoprenylcysteine carboxylmethyltransferase family protein [Cyclobacteriaceae bacterium]|nr:isoprenylcysteine carboxylmethyltransferase family protein [Cyclobacteriaceae bacterium]